MRFTIEQTEPVQLVFECESLIEEAAQAIQIVLNTPINTVPLNRDFGMDMSYKGMPINTAKALYANAAAEAIESNIPWIRVNQVNFADSIGDELNPIIEVSFFG